MCHSGVALEGMASRVVEPRKPSAAHLIVDADVEAVAGEPHKIARVVLHVRPAEAAVETDDGHAPVPAGGRPYWFVEQLGAKQRPSLGTDPRASEGPVSAQAAVIRS